MKYTAVVGNFDIDMAAVRFAQYISTNVEDVKATIKPSQAYRGRYVVRMHSNKKMANSLIASVSGAGVGIEWQIKHDQNLVPPVSRFYEGCDKCGDVHDGDLCPSQY